MRRLGSPDLLDVEMWHGVVLIVGASDSGKSTLARALWPRLASSRSRPAFIDADVGQGRLGPPTTQTLAMFSLSHPDAFPPRGQWLRYFVGSISPRGHMLPTVIGLSLLVREARRQHADLILVDTTGMVDPDRGGIALKAAKIELLRPRTVVILEHSNELSSLLSPWEAFGARFMSLPISSDVRPRTPEVRRERRRLRFQGYFQRSEDIVLVGVPVVGNGEPAPNQLVGLLDRRGFLMALAVVQEADSRVLKVLTPLGEERAKSAVAVRLGDLWLDPETGEHGWIPRDQGRRSNQPVGSGSQPGKERGI